MGTKGLNSYRIYSETPEKGLPCWVLTYKHPRTETQEDRTTIDVVHVFFHYFSSLVELVGHLQRSPATYTGMTLDISSADFIQLITSAFPLSR